MMSAYLDERFNNRTVCIGGWIGQDIIWKRISEQWNDRIDYENRRSRKKGLKILTRFHAADCAGLRGEFEGWDSARRDLFVKRLLGILVSHKPMAFGWAIDFSQIENEFPASDRQSIVRSSYGFCVKHLLKEIGEVMTNFYTGEQIRFIHDRGGLCSSAQDAFAEFVEAAPRWRDYFVGFEVKGWEDCSQLQMADLIAYDVFKLCDVRMNLNGAYVRRSLRAVTGKNVPIVAGYMDVRKLLQMYRERPQQTDRLHDDVAS